MAEEFVVESENRLDRFLAGKLDYSRERVKDFVHAGYVKVNGGIVKKPSERLVQNDNVAVKIPSRPPVRKLPEEIVPQDVPFEVLYEDSSVLVVNKPTGVVVHPAYRHPDKTLLNGVVKYLQGAGEAVPDPRPVHRLDKDTSGVILIAKTEEALFKLAKQFESREVSKEYDVLVHGEFSLPNFSKETKKRLKLKVGKEASWAVFGCNLRRSKEDRRKIVVGETGRWAISKYKVKKSCKKASWLTVRLITGRTHQIRAQLNFLGFSVIGDPMYSTKAQDVNAGRMMLHSSMLKIRLPGGEKKRFTSEVPVEIGKFYEQACKE